MTFQKGNIYGFTSFKGHKHTEETKEKNRQKHLGKKHLEESIRKMKGRKVWNKGNKGLQVAWNKGLKGFKPTQEARRNMREAKIRYVEKTKFDGMPLMPTIGKQEKHILDNLQKCLTYTILRQYKINGYFLDGYCPALNLAIEIDEPRHNNIIKEDIMRQEEIERGLNCQFLRIKVGD